MTQVGIPGEAQTTFTAVESDGLYEVVDGQVRLGTLGFPASTFTAEQISSA